MWLGYFTLGRGLAPPANGIPQARSDRVATPRAQALTPAVLHAGVAVQMLLDHPQQAQLELLEVAGD